MDRRIGILLVLLLFGIATFTACGRDRGSDSVEETETPPPVAGEPNVSTTEAAAVERATVGSATEVAVVEATATVEPTPVPTETATDVATSTPVATETPAATDTPTNTATAAPTATPVSTSTSTPASTPTLPSTSTATAAPTASPLPTHTSSPIPTDTPVVTDTPVATATPTVVPTSTPTTQPTASPTARPGQTPAATSVMGTEAIETVETPEERVISVAEMRRVADVIGVDEAPLATLSPDGRQIAWVVAAERGYLTAVEFCVHSLEQAESETEPDQAAGDGEGGRCFPTPETFLGFPSTLVWSPDSTRIAFAEDVFRLGYESDIWLLDVAAGEFSNVTDDGVEGEYGQVAHDAAQAGVWLDYLPLWDRTTGALNFWRTMTGESANPLVQLMRMGLEENVPEEAMPLDDMPEEVIQFDAGQGGQLFAFDERYRFMDGPVSISPDGTQMAFLVSTLPAMTGGLESGLWVVDLTEPSAAAELVADFVSFDQALPEWQNIPALPMGLSWTGDGSGVVVLAVSQDIQTSMVLLYYVDPDVSDEDGAVEDGAVKDGAVTAVVDFANVGDREDYFMAQEAGDFAPRFYSPWTAALWPAQNVLLMFNDIGGIAALLASDLPPDGALPDVIYQRESQMSPITTRSSVSELGRVLIDGWLLTIEQDGTAESAD